MAGKFITNTVAATHGGSAVEGLLDVSEQWGQVEKEKPGDGAPVERDVVDNTMTLRLTFSSVQAAQDFAAAAEANLVLRQRKFGGTQEDVTYKNVKATGTEVSVPTLQDTSIARASITARATFGAADTYATMKTSAPVS